MNHGLSGYSDNGLQISELSTFIVFNLLLQMVYAAVNFKDIQIIMDISITVGILLLI